MQIKSVTVTPDQAKEWLKGNKLNRPIRKSYVHKLAEAMKRGEWGITHQPIALANGRLLDGQHRLLALVDSQLPKLQMSVAYDADPATFDIIDVGINRSAADIFREDRHVINPISFIGRIIYGRYTMHQLQPIYIRFHKQLRELQANVNRNTRMMAAPIKAAAVAAVLDGESKEYVNKLYQDMCAFNAKALPDIAISFLKQISMGNKSGGRGAGRKVGSSERDQLLVRAFTVFHKGNANQSWPSVKNLPMRVDAIRKLFRTEMGVK